MATQLYAESLWLSLKRDRFPMVSGEHEKELKIAFMHGLNSGRSLLLQALSLDPRTCVEFCREFQGQVEASLRALGETPGKVSVGVKVRASIDGDPV